jgi:hypothetical protein
MLFIGVSLCSDTVLNTTGFNNRYQAKEIFYQRAKDIYDSGWETDTVVKLQSLFLLSFWRGSPTEERDVRFWLGAAIGLAQKKGMHVMYGISFHKYRIYADMYRSKLSFLNAKDQKIWKRIWWALYVPFSFQLYKTMRLTSHQVRDQQTSAALGLPPRIRDEDCQIADLEAADFDDRQLMGTPGIFRTPPEVHISYVIGMTQLARLRMIHCDNSTIEFADYFPF